MGGSGLLPDPEDVGEPFGKIIDLDCGSGGACHVRYGAVAARRQRVTELWEVIAYTGHTRAVEVGILGGPGWCLHDARPFLPPPAR